MIYKINNNYYVKVYENRYARVEFKEINGEINLIPTQDVLESTLDMKVEECNTQIEKEKFKNKEAMVEKASKYKKY